MHYSRIHQQKSHSKGTIKNGRWLPYALLEFGVFFVVFENLLRKAVPGLNTPILGFKFAYFPMVYLILRQQTIEGFNRFPRKGALLVFLSWGTLVTFFLQPLGAFAAAVAVAVNIGFVPTMFLGFQIYKTPMQRLRLFKRLVFLGVLCSAIAIIQSSLSASHWMNRLMDDQDAIRYSSNIRVASTFQYCNVYASFVVAPLLAAFGVFLAADSKRWQWTAVLLMGFIYACGTLSGSRTSAIIPLAVLGAAALTARRQLDTQRMQKMAIIIAIGGFVGLTLFHEELYRWLAKRHFSSVKETFLARLDMLYLGRGVQVANRVSDGTGTGWGVYTYGVSRWFDRSVGRNARYLEGGYVYIIAQTGFIGLVSLTTFLVSRCWGSVKSDVRWLCFGVVTWAILGNLPISMTELPAIAIPWWLLVGVSATHAPDRP